MHHTDYALTTQRGQTPWSQRKPGRAAERAARYIPLAVNSHYYIKHCGGYSELVFLKNTVIMGKGENWKNWEIIGFGSPRCPVKESRPSVSPNVVEVFSIFRLFLLCSDLSARQKKQLETLRPRSWKWESEKGFSTWKNVWVFARSITVFLYGHILWKSCFVESKKPEHG